MAFSASDPLRQYNYVLHLLSQNDLAEALKVANTIDTSVSTQSFDFAYLAISESQLAQRDIPGALTSAQTIRKEFDRDRAYRKITVAQLETNDLPGALSTARKITDSLSKCIGLRDVAIAQLQSGKYLDARNTALEIPDSATKAYTLREIDAVVVISPNDGSTFLEIPF